MYVRVLKNLSGPTTGPYRPGQVVEVDDATGQAWIKDKAACEVGIHAKTCAAWNSEREREQFLAKADREEKLANRSSKTKKKGD